MKNNFSRIGILIFFSAALVISTVLLVGKDDPESIETMNTLPQEYRTQTAAETDIIADDNTVISETAPTERSIGRDLDIGTAPIFSIGEAETEVPVYYDDESDEPQEYHAEPSDERTGQAQQEQQVQQTTAATTSRTVITSRQRKAYDSNSVYIDMENILQNPELPVGCEITALTILLRYYGFNAEKTDMARNYLPRSSGNAREVDGKIYKDSFYDYFVGDPFSRGYGCFSPAIERAANSYISSHGGGYTVKNISGCHPDTLYEYLIQDIPVLCWATDGMIEPEYYESWYDNATGEKLDWYLNEHCFVLTGFNITNSTVTLNDPMKGIIDYNIDRFEVRFKQMHSQAIVLIPNTPEPVTEPPEETTAPVTESETYTSETVVPESVTETVSETEGYSETISEAVSESETETENTDIWNTADTPPDTYSTTTAGFVDIPQDLFPHHDEEN